MLVPLLGAAKGALTKPKAKKQDVKIDPAKFSGKVEGSKAKVKGKSRPTTVKPVAPKVVNINVEREKKTVVTGQDPLIKQVELTYVRTIQIQQLLRDRAKQKQKDEKKKLNWFQRLFRKNREEGRENLALKVLGGLGGAVISKGMGLLESIMGIIGTLFAGWLLQFIPQIVQAIQTGLEWLGNLRDALKPYVTPVWDALKWMAGAAAKFLVDPDVLEKDSNSFLQNLNILDQRLGVIKKAFDLVVAACLFSAAMQIWKSVSGILGGMWDMFRNFRKLWKRIFPKQKFNLKNIKKPNYRQLELDLDTKRTKPSSNFWKNWRRRLNPKNWKLNKVDWSKLNPKNWKMPRLKGLNLSKAQNFKGKGGLALLGIQLADIFMPQLSGGKYYDLGDWVQSLYKSIGLSKGSMKEMSNKDLMDRYLEVRKEYTSAYESNLKFYKGNEYMARMMTDKMLELTAPEMARLENEIKRRGLIVPAKPGSIKDEFEEAGLDRKSLENDTRVRKLEPGEVGSFLKGDLSSTKLNDSNLIGHSAMYDKPAEVEFIPFPVSSGGSASGESGSSGGFSLDLGSDVYDVAALNREASNLAKVWA